MLEHGGKLRRAAEHFDIPLHDWLDLSTGIAPYGFDLPAIPSEAWLRLPETEDELETAAQGYFGAASLLPVAGSQAAIQMLPRLRRPLQVGIVSPCYAEHAEAWRREGHRLSEFSEGSVPRALDGLDVLVVVNPNNPTGRLLPPEQLLAWHGRLAERGGWLIVDEAFMDPTPSHSLAPHSHLPGLIVLRSFGKFFGMAGARLGFVLAEQSLLSVLSDALGPWPIAGPSRFIGTVLLADLDGQRRQRERLLGDSARLAQLLSERGLPPAGGCGLFHWVVTEEAMMLREFLACQGILVRRFLHPPSVRFGLPADEAGWARLTRALSNYQALSA
ncbi:threonine-phosphate decarboxylase [Pseudomonas sp. Choline-3u-10]|jgi:cobalamin biosynthetic protein CobC|uniref:threonine-phosphate decarboxylase CobD n=1 Tax=Pseudomonadaceae TaxID=135621 RepID=UPI0006182FE2|nr:MULTISPECIES: threonine-phosphate decarboxylase CobD [Pseudomonadaceae]MAL34562.1 threonine-phosphate decarboxylase [Pseudomonas sp.]MBU0950998.1 threonine-phosphate decarboxylase CobD [Gammaproteobacteria bacterium]KJJ63823.1 threonine-phosphate decarboxylase [Pseudomonas sp. 10B238]MBK3795056.1 threonine-phosphate decarboxylase [Stutzerimonas stutzeri]MBK3878591.1 threonine-phosphate decarboxylase [Stutzerimonas stutzeri]|tara:strand:+ start:495 stop:1487 length:993 start_codon:yes stop_codon:yes gene_type:complete